MTKRELHKVRPKVSAGARARAKAEPVSMVREDSSRANDSPQNPRVAAPRATKGGGLARRPAEVAFEKIVAPARGKAREGWRHGWLGRTRIGKTFANARLLEYALREGVVDVILNYDVKAPLPQYEGTERFDAADFREHPPGEGESAHVIFRPRDGRFPLLGPVASEAMALAWGGIAVLLNVDELAKAATPAGRDWGVQEVRTVMSEGGGIGASISWTTQVPQRIPTEGIDLASTISIMSLEGRSLRYVEGTADLLGPEEIAAVKTLQRGEFILWENGADWDRTIYVVE